jgi:integrase
MPETEKRIHFLPSGSLILLIRPTFEVHVDSRRSRRWPGAAFLSAESAMHASTWHIDSTSILSRRELATVLADAKAKAARTANSWRNLIVFRLARCCGLRVSEIAQLEMGDVIADVERSHLRLRRGATKGGKARTVPLWWDAGTLADLRAWKA